MAKHSPVALLEWTSIHRSSITLFRCSACVWKRWELHQRKKVEVFLRYSWPKMLWTFVAWWLIFSLCESDRVYFPDSFLGRTMVGALCWDAPRIRWLFSRKTGFRGSSWVMRSRWRIVGFNQWVGVFHGGLSLVQTKALWKGIPTRNMNLYIPTIYRLQQDMNSGSCFQPSSLNYSYLLFLHIIIIKIQSPLTDN